MEEKELGCGDTTCVVQYVSLINVNYKRGVDEFLEGVVSCEIVWDVLEWEETGVQ